jgi:DNA topoisomerase-3
MRLVIAEKPSLARAIADALGPHARKADHIACADGTVVAWCAGHVLESAEPQDYDPSLATWRLDDLPFVPAEWKLLPKSPKLLKTLEALLQRATRVVHAGDPDREGQLLVDEVLEFFRYRGPVDRLLVSDTNPDAVRRQLAALQPNAAFQPLSHAARARQRADWLYGMNLSRLYTLLGRAAGFDGILSVGRVQTPLLGLIVRRDLAIERFQPAPYYVVTATLATADGSTFSAHWEASEAASAHLDESKRLRSKPFAESIAARVAGATGTITERAADKKSQPPPLPYSLAELQIDAAKRLGLSAQAVLDAAQSLYETHRLTTYPRSDCSYLPEGHHALAPKVVAAIEVHAPSLAATRQGASLDLRSKAWNDKKVTAHHALIPTASKAPAALSPTERALYELVARRYLLQFYPPHEYMQTTLVASVAGERFTATGRQVLAVGWRVAAEPEPPAAADQDDEAQLLEAAAPLPAVSPGDPATARAVHVGDKVTRPPKRFTDASLLHAMVHVAAFVTDPAVKRLLTDADGIGTNATRAAIIELLFKRGYIARDRKTIVSTATGRAFVAALPTVATTPDMTAVWEAALRAIAERQQDLPSFLDRVTAQLRHLVAEGRALGRLAVPKAAPPPAAAPRRRRSITRRSPVRSAPRSVAKVRPSGRQHPHRSRPMTVQTWGHTSVSSALEVFNILTSPPADPGYRARWQELLSVEPPFWGSLLEHGAVLGWLFDRAYRLWSWDDHGAVLSPRDLSPPLGVQYRTWDFLRHELDELPTRPRLQSVCVYTRIHDDTENLVATPWPTPTS